MAIDLEGKRPRYFHEREDIAGQEGYPLRDDVSTEARRRLVREIIDLAWQTVHGKTHMAGFIDVIWADLRRVLGDETKYVHMEPEARLSPLPLTKFLTFLEIAAGQIYWRRGITAEIAVLQSVLADDLSSFRFVDTGKKPDPKDRFRIQKIDNAHLHREIVDRTFELTRIAEFAVAQRDYAEAWKDYSMGNLDASMVNAHKAFESAAKVIIKRVDPASSPDQMQTKDLVPELKRLEIIPAKLTNLLNPLVQVFQNAGALRNAPGAGHGSLDLTTPEANAALFALRLSGSLVSFMAQRWESMKPAK